MRNKLRSLLLVLTAVLLSCNFSTQVIPADNSGTGTPLASSAQSDGFSAEATTDGIVLLKWQPISGAENYLLEVQIGDEFVPLATLPADQTSHEDVNVPPATRFTYRLSSLVSSKPVGSKEITVETPQAVPNPLQVTIEYDQSPASLSIDPNNFDPSSIDPNNFDPSNFLPQPIKAEAVIGPQGGEISATGSNGVIYTLSVPPNALRFEVPITLKPISSISDLPLSGGLMAAVFIEPESLVFDIPATLTMTPPGDFPDIAGPLVMAFSFETDGQEFHLYPFATDGAQSKMNRHLASLQAIPDFVPPLSDFALAKLRYGGGYGQGSGDHSDEQQLAKNSPSKSQNRTAQHLAMIQLDDLAPLVPSKVIKLAEYGESILQKAGKANDWGKFMEALDDFSTYINAGGDKDKFNQKRTDKILDKLVENAQMLLKKNKGDCLTYDDFTAQELVERLTNPKDSFSKAFADRFQQKYGQQLLYDLAFAKKTCSYQLTMKSTLTFDDSVGSTLITTAKSPKMKLFLTYSKGEIYLSGGGTMDLSFRVAGECSHPLKQYNNLIFMVDKLTPVFEYGQLKDFSLSRSSVHGWEKAVKAKGSWDNGGCPTMVNVTGGGDFWTGLFRSARFSLSNQFMTGWTVQNNLIKGNTLKANWQSVVPTFTALGKEGVMSEDTKFELLVTKKSR